MVTFTGGVANKPLYVQSIFLTNDSQYDPTGVVDLPIAAPSTSVDVYSLSGQLLRRQVRREQALQGLPKGLYIVNGHKVLWK